MMGLLKRLFGESEGAFVPGLFSFCCLLVSKFFNVPIGKDYFRVGAFIGALVGYALGNACLHGRSRKAVVIVAILAFVTALPAMVFYEEFIGSGHVVNALDQLWALAALSYIFACVGVLMPVAGIKFAEPRDSEDTEQIKEPQSEGGAPATHNLAQTEALARPLS